jgi:hypothetical protein
MDKIVQNNLAAFLFMASALLFAVAFILGRDKKKN